MWAGDAMVQIHHAKPGAIDRRLVGLIERQFAFENIYRTHEVGDETVSGEFVQI